MGNALLLYICDHKPDPFIMSFAWLSFVICKEFIVFKVLFLHIFWLYKPQTHSVQHFICHVYPLQMKYGVFIFFVFSPSHQDFSEL